jgi:5-methylcytosine-specific restriction endonuclease McrBC GTP-binding regulatory subunit McrB
VANAIEQMPVDLPIHLNPVYRTDDTETLDHIEIITDTNQLPEDVSVPERADEASNHLFLSVRPDWRDSTSLLGYYNPLTETYEWTGFLHFLLRAVESHQAKDSLAWFVILDEMNLAHVEYYFADLLSVIESGRDDNGLSREPLRLTYPDTLVDNAPPSEIYFPPNLYIIGTVNMDETTHAFSPKVLDRAFTIELTDVDFSAYPGSPNGASAELPDAAKHELLRTFTRNKRFAVVDKDDIRRIVAKRPEIRRWLQSLNDLLKRDRFHFGYRVFDEVGQFVFNAGLNGMLAFEEAFDHAVFMKVLPKFTGSRARLRSPLLSVLAWAVSPEAPDPKGVDAMFRAILDGADANRPALSTDAFFPHVATRALQMLETLETDGFVSFG